MPVDTIGNDDWQKLQAPHPSSKYIYFRASQTSEQNPNPDTLFGETANMTVDARRKVRGRLLKQRFARNLGADLLLHSQDRLMMKPGNHLPEFLEQQLKSCRTLPSIPAVAVRIVELCREENVSVADIANVIGRDPALATKLLRVSNSVRTQAVSVPSGYAMNGFGPRSIKSSSSC